MRVDYRIFWLIVAIVTSVSFGFSQQSTNRIRVGDAVWSTVAIDYYVTDSNHIFLETNGRWFQFTGQDNRAFQRAHVELGFNHKFNEHWFVGGSGKWVNESFIGHQAFFRLTSSHLGYLGKLLLYEKLNFESINRYRQQNNLRNYYLFRPSLDIGLVRNWQLTRVLCLYAEFSLRSFMLFDLERLNDQDFGDRFIDMTRSKLNLWLNMTTGPFGANYSIGIFGMNESEYFYSTVSERKLNLSSWILGVELRIILSRNATSNPRRNW